MIRYRKTGGVKVSRSEAPEPPFGAAATVEPYSFPRTAGLALDPVRLIGTAVDRADVEVRELSSGDLDLLQSPVLIDATESAELVYRRGEECHRRARERALSVIHLISTLSGIPTIPPSAESLVALSAWPLYFRDLESAAAGLAAAGWRWGLAIPILFSATTQLDVLERLARIAVDHRAEFLTGIRFDLDPNARRALAVTWPTDDETYSTLFDEGADAVAVATERHIAALATDSGLADAVTSPDREQRSNWNAAMATSLAGYRLIETGEDVELGWELIRSARQVATLAKPLTTIAGAASLSIVDGILPQLLEALEQWLVDGKADLFEGISERWRLRRDYRR